jgi:hypothetical protein
MYANPAVSQPTKQSAIETSKRKDQTINSSKTFNSKSYHSAFAPYIRYTNLIQRAFFAALLIMFLPVASMAAQVTLAWDLNTPTPDGYRVYQRAQGDVYDYNSPVWPADGSDHTETTCTVGGLTEGATYYYVVRAYVGSDESGDSNEVSYQVPAAQPEIHTISASSGSNGSISPSGRIDVNDGDSQTFIFTPNTGYQVADVMVDGSSVGAVQSYTFSNVTKDCTISVTFQAKSFTITATAGSNGSITPSGGVSVIYGQDQTFDFSPNSGYQISYVQVDGQSQGVVSTFTFSNVTQDHTIRVYFMAVPAQNRSPIAEAGANQTVSSGSQVTLNGSGSYDPDGDSITYQWRQSSGIDVGLECRTARCVFTAPTVITSGATTLAFELTVADSSGLFDSDTCLIEVDPAQAPPDNDGDGTPDDQDSDDDNDGMPDSWELQYGLNPFSSNDAGLDADNDGITNVEEYRNGTNPIEPDVNRKPNQPALRAPIDGNVDVDLTPWLRASAFEDPDSGDVHKKTQWQITAGAGQQIVLNRFDIKNHKLNTRVPRLVLNPSTQYSARVRFFDDSDLASDWSDPVTFTTAADKKDTNKNNIPDDQEVSGHTDMNGDNIADIDQEDTIKSFSTYDDQKLVGVSIEDSENADAVAAAASIDTTTLDTTLESATVSEDETPYGLLGYKILVSQPGDSTTTTLYLSDPLDASQVTWKCYDDINGWQDCSGSTVVDEEGFVVERNLQDGGQEDADGVANGVIVDLSGPQQAASGDGSSLALSDDDSASPGGGSGGGCFIQMLFGK